MENGGVAVNKKIMTAEVIVYSTKYCPYCTAAKELLNREKIVFQEIPVDDDPSLRKKMEELSGRRTVPQIFINGRHVGGFDDLKQLYDKGELKHWLSA